jgi:hypothetical protein
MTYKQEQIHRRRRVATVLAALLLGGAGFALAMSVELSIGLKIVDVERVAPWAVAKAALGNAAMVFGFSTTAASAFWLWRELSVTENRYWTGRTPCNRLRQCFEWRICRTCM